MKLDSEYAASRIALADADATDALAQALARTAPTSAVAPVVFLHGDLGAGKSTLARAWLRALGVQGAIRSPTYTLVERYPLTKPELRPHDAQSEGAQSEGAQSLREAVHLDLYRIGSGSELEFLGLDDIPAALWLVEWPERGQGGLLVADLHIRLALPEGEVDGRVCRLDAGTAAGQAWLERLAAKHGLRLLPEA
jgi:tRNA threonylcarbamoyladenosine biosynthesis protein TsaE